MIPHNLLLLFPAPPHRCGNLFDWLKFHVDLVPFGLEVALSRHTTYDMCRSTRDRRALRNLVPLHDSSHMMHVSSRISRVGTNMRHDFDVSDLMVSALPKVELEHLQGVPPSTGCGAILSRVTRERRDA